MSKIKDLYAEVNNIDDLKPIRSRQTTTRYDKAFYDAINELNNKRIGEMIYAKAKNWDGLRSWFRSNAEYDAGKDDDGHTEWYFENFEDLCEQAVNGAMDKLIEEEHLDISDETYNRAIEYGRDWLADALADFESECIQDYVMDRKHILDEVKERNGQC